jgi:predicted DNA-binding transcriptional regulator AlpA
MPVKISKAQFYSVTEVAEVADVTRQTIWRWHKDKKIPGGRKYRGRNVVFAQDGFERIYADAHRIEPSGETDDFADQLNLFEQRQPDSGGRS